MRDIVVIAHDMRSAHNVGSLFRTCEGLGVSKLLLTGITPYPRKKQEDRLPHLAEKLDKQIDKTALGATRMLRWEHLPDVEQVIRQLASAGYRVLALEQSTSSIPLPAYEPSDKVALLLGNEVSGLDEHLLSLASETLEIPMFGSKESFNVVQAAAMCLYKLRFD